MFIKVIYCKIHINTDSLQLFVVILYGVFHIRGLNSKVSNVNKLCYFAVSGIFMNSIGDNCNELKKQYDSCFLTWFSEKFLKGDTNDEMCAPYFKVYQQCVKVCPHSDVSLFTVGVEACHELKKELTHA